MRGVDDKGTCPLSPIRSQLVESKFCLQLLDNTEVDSYIDTGTYPTSTLADPDPGEDAEFESPAKARRKTGVKGSHPKTRKKPLPATYEPGT